MSRPDTKYVAIGDADVAYQVLGEGPSDLLFFIGLGSNVEMAWEDPDIADFLVTPLDPLRSKRYRGI